MNTKLRYLAVLVAATLVLLWCIPSFGQVVRGSISGSVLDPQGAVVSGAQVKARNTETGVVYNTTSDSAGLYRFNLLPVGTYTVDVVASGFKTSSQTNIVVTAGKDAGLSPTRMALGETSTTLEVTAAAPLIETTQSQVTNTFSGTTLSTFAGIQENEGLDRLALFVPGVVATRSDNFSNTNGVGFSSNGLRGRNNDQEIDGQNNNDNSVGGPGLFLSDTEFVGQYVLITNQFGPDTVRNAGSVVNIITKSGTNAWHGSVFGQNRSSYTEALSNTQHNTPKPGSQSPTNPQGLPFTGPPRFNEEFSGGTVGGALVKNKAFLFGGFDNDLFSGTNVFTTTGATPTPTGLAQLAACPFTNPTALAIMQKFGPYGFSFGNPSPRPNATLPGGGLGFGNISVGSNPATACSIQTGGVTRVVSTPSHGFDFVVRNDVQLGSDTLTSRYLFNRNNTFNINDNGAGGWFRNTPALSQALLESWTHNFSPRMVNEARVSFSRLNVEFGGGLNPFEPVADQVTSALTNISFQAGGGLSIGPATNLPQARLVNTWQAQDNWNYVVGKHNFKAGVNWTYQRSPNIFLPIINGQFRFADLGTFLTSNTPNRVQIAQGNPVLDFREYDTFAYAGDDWKISPNLTLNLGVTWTYYGQPANLFHDLTTSRESDPAKAFWLQSLPLDQRTNPAIPAIMNSFGPSAGSPILQSVAVFSLETAKWSFAADTVCSMIRRSTTFSSILHRHPRSPSCKPLRRVCTSSLSAQCTASWPSSPHVLSSQFIAHNKFDPRTQNETTVSPDFGPDKVHSWSFGLSVKSPEIQLWKSGMSETTAPTCSRRWMAIRT